MAILAREGCPELERIAARDYVFLGHSDIAKVQAMKKSFLHKFWKVSGREVVREAAQRRLEDVSTSFFLPSSELVCRREDMLLTVLLFLCRQSDLMRRRRVSWRRELVRKMLQGDPGLEDIKKLMPRAMLPRFRPVTTLAGDFCKFGGDIDLYSDFLLLFV